MVLLITTAVLTLMFGRGSVTKHIRNHNMEGIWLGVIIAILVVALLSAIGFWAVYKSKHPD